MLTGEVRALMKARGVPSMPYANTCSGREHQVLGLRQEE